jgi:predicted amidohydrolase
MKTFRIAAVVCRACVGETDRNMKRMEHWIGQAARKDASLICFPEMSITGYGIRSNMADSAESVPGKSSESLLKLAAKENIVVLAGIAEADVKGRIYAGHLIAEPTGILGIYRKLHIPPPERGLFTPGNETPLFEAQGFKFAVQLCYDTHFPELSTHMALKGADIIFMPHASPRGTPAEKYRSWLRHLPARAYDNGVFVVACNQTGDNGQGLSFPGVALVIGPSGEVVSKVLNDEEEMLIADINTEALAAVRTHRMRYFLPNRRGDLFPMHGG